MTLSNYEPSVAPLDGRTLPEYILRELRRIGGIFREYSLELSPGGATGEVQFNDNGSLTGDSVFTYDKTANVLNVPHIALDKLSFDLSASGSISTGQLLWNADDGTLDLGLSNGAVLQIGQETVYYSKNTSGSTISTGRAVMFTGAVGTSGKLTFGLAVANGTVDHEYMMGIASQNIPDNDFGMVTHFGLVRNLRTDGANKTVPETWSDGVLLYLDSSYPGELTRNKPTFPGFAMPIAVVVNATSGNSGSLFVRMKTGERLSELHDVEFVSLSDGHILRYDTSASHWQTVRLVYQSGTTFGDGQTASSVFVNAVRYQPVPFSGRLFRADIVADATADATIEIWKASGALPTASDKISAASPVVLLSQLVNSDVTLSGWSLTLAPGDILGFKLISLSGSPTMVTLNLGARA